MTETSEDRNLNWYATREPVVLILLSLIAVLFFLSVTGLSNIYRRQQKSRGIEWFGRGNADLKAGHLPRAADDFRVALTYSRENYAYQLGLAQALLALRRTDEAYAYLVNLWQRQPDNGTVNLELGRIFANKGDVSHTLRYYHNAIYAAANGRPDTDRRAVSFELIEFLLREKANDQAESELIVLAGNLPDDAAVDVRVGDLFLQVPNYEHALAAYRQALKLRHHDPAAEAGTGRAAFELARYALAQRYLESAVASNPGDLQSAGLLKTVQLIAKLDPYRINMPPIERNRIILEDLKTAGDRLKACPTESPAILTSANGTGQTLNARWLQMKHKLAVQRLQNQPELANAVADLVFNIEVETNQNCGTPNGPDLALLLIARAHEGN